MRLIKAFAWISGASAAILPIVMRQMSVEMNKLMRKNNRNIPEFQMPLILPEMPDMQMPTVKIPFPVAYCDGLKEDSANNLLKKRLMAEKNKQILKLSNEETNKRFNHKNYEKLLSKADYSAISEAYKNDEIDFSYMPRKPKFYLVLLDMESEEGNEMIKKYFESGVMEEMRTLGLLKYQNIIESAVNRENYLIANLALDYMIAAMLKEVDTEGFKESDWLMSHGTFTCGFRHMRSLEKTKCFGFWYFNLSENERQMFKFFDKHDRIFVDHQFTNWCRGLDEFPWVF